MYRFTTCCTKEQKLKLLYFILFLMDSFLWCLWCFLRLAENCQAPGPLLGPGQGPAQGLDQGPCQGPGQGPGLCLGQGP